MKKELEWESVNLSAADLEEWTKTFPETGEGWRGFTMKLKDAFSISIRRGEELATWNLPIKHNDGRNVWCECVHAIDWTLPAAGADGKKLWNWERLVVRNLMFSDTAGKEFKDVIHDAVMTLIEN